MLVSIIKKNKILWNIYLKLHYEKTNIKIRKLERLDEKEYPQYLAKEYQERVGKTLNWDKLESYNEKMQWAKLYDRDPKKTEYSDKVAVRKFVEKTIGEEYLIPIYGVWKNYDDIDFSKLPDNFVLKTNNGSNTNVIVKNKSTINHKVLKKQFDRWLKTDYSLLCGFELQYRNIEPKIIAEKYVETPSGDLRDYKFLCFDGVAYYCWVDIGRYIDHKRNVYDLEWNLQPWNQYNYGNYDKRIDKPKNFEKMIKIAEKLSSGFSHVRVDLYNVDGQIYFGEMTFTNGSGFEPIIPEQYNKMLGDLWKLPRK